MSLFINQRIYCQNCGKEFFGQPGFGSGGGTLVCDKLCQTILGEKYSCYVLGKKWEDSDCYKIRHDAYDKIKNINLSNVNTKVSFSRQTLHTNTIKDVMSK